MRRDYEVNYVYCVYFLEVCGQAVEAQNQPVKTIEDQ